MFYKSQRYITELGAIIATPETGIFAFKNQLHCVCIFGVVLYKKG